MKRVTTQKFIYTSRLRFLVIVIVIGASLLWMYQEYQTYTHTPLTWYVSPQGNDALDGRTEMNAFATIQQAINTSQSGDTIYLLPGEYLQDIKTVRSGRKNKPITITGDKTAVVRGGGRPRVIEIQHSYITVNGFTVDGLFGDGSKSSGYREKLIYIMNSNNRSGISNVKILGMHVKNSGGECIRVRYFAHDIEIAYSYIYRCGVYDYAFENGGQNGEGIYIGTAPEQEGKGGAPSKDHDNSRNITIHHNIIDPEGSECVNVKESSHHVAIINNRCLSQWDRNSAGFDIRGACTIIANNEIGDSSKRPLLGATIRIGAQKDFQAPFTDIKNNLMVNYQYETAVKYPTQERPGKICGNTNPTMVDKFDEQFSDYPAIINQATCTQGNTTIGTYGCIGPDCAVEPLANEIQIPSQPDCISWE
ncbi:hypothetical protein HGA91_03925 [candidate division WWE3 bacterium]|nr:hypothetical protein [candidate division WWE3 bacterium]